MLNAVAGTWFVDEGKITIDDYRRDKAPEHKRAKYLGRVFQDPMTGTAATNADRGEHGISSKKRMTRSLKAESPQKSVSSTGAVKDLRPWS